MSDVLTESHAVTHARTPDAGEAPPLDFDSQFDGSGPAAGNRDLATAGWDMSSTVVACRWRGRRRWPQRLRRPAGLEFQDLARPGYGRPYCRP